MWLLGGGPLIKNYHNPPLAFSPLVSALNNENTEIEVFPLCFGSYEKEASLSSDPTTHRGFIIAIIILLSFPPFLPFSCIYFIMPGT